MNGRKEQKRIATMRRIPFAILRESNSEEEECIPNTSEDFPQDLFTIEQKKHGAVVLHFILGVYCFTLLAVVCNDYFLPSVERICEAMNLSEVSKILVISNNILFVYTHILRQWFLSPCALLNITAFIMIKSQLLF